MNESELLRRIAQAQQIRISAETGLSTSQINRVVAGQAGLTLKHIGPFLSALGLLVTDQSEDAVTIDRAELDALKLLAKKAL